MRYNTNCPIRDLSQLENWPCLLRVDEVAAIMGRSEAAIYSKINRGQIPVVRFKPTNHIIGVEPKALLALMDREGVHHG